MRRLSMISGMAAFLAMAFSDSQRRMPKLPKVKRHEVGRVYGFIDIHQQVRAVHRAQRWVNRNARLKACRKTVQPPPRHIAEKMQLMAQVS